MSGSGLIERNTLWKVLYRVAVALLLLVVAGFALHEIASPWLWGHNGYNGAAFSQAARNTLRFGILGQAQYWTAPSPPEPVHMYTRHPPLLHLHIAALYAVLGDQVWVGRLVPAIYSVLSAAMLFTIVRRYWGRATALVALAVWAFMPINLIYANMINHEQASVFWLLVMLYSWLRWLDCRRRSWFLALLASTTIACQFDWPPYYVAFFIAAHGAALGLSSIGARRRRGERAFWSPELTTVAIFSVVVLINFVGYFAWIYSVRGSLDEMIAAFRQRSGTPEDVWSMSLGNLPDMIQPLALILAFAWFIAFLIRAGRQEARTRDLVPIAFLLAQIIHQGVFKVAGYLHIYWLYHGGPFVAIGAGCALTWLGGRCYRLSGSAPVRQKMAAIGASFTVGLSLGWLAVEGINTTLWARSYSGSPYRHPGHTFYEEGVMATRLNQQTGPDEAIVFHSAIQFRVEVLWYLDRPTETLPQEIEVDRQVLGSPTALYVADITATPRHYLRPFFSEGYHLTLLDGRWLVIDLRKKDGTVQAFQLQEEDPSFLWNFLVTPHEPPLSWVEDPAGVERVEALVETL